MDYTVAELAEIVGGLLFGDGRGIIRKVLPNDCATPDAIAFLSPEKSNEDAKNCQAGALLVRRGFGPAARPTIEVADPRQAALTIAEMFRPPIPKPKPGVHPTAVIDPAATISATCHIGPFAVIEAGVSVGDRSVVHSHAVLRAGCAIGTDVEIHSHAVLYPHTVVGDRGIIHAGVVLGCDGFGYAFTGEGHTKVPQLGNVEIQRDVEIGANSTIDRGTLGSTTIDQGTKLDNLVMVGHNCRIGKYNALAAQVGMAGSCKTGDFVFLGGKAGVADHVSIGDGAVLLGYTGAHKNIAPGERQFGIPAQSVREFAAERVAIAQVPKLRKEIAELKKRIEHLITDRKCA